MVATSSNPEAIITSGFAIFAPGGPKGPQASNAIYKMSYITGCGGANTMAVQCATGPWPCGLNAETTTITENLSEAMYTHTRISDGISTSVFESCTLSGQYSAACTAHYDLSWSGTKTHYAQTTVFANGDEFMSNVYRVNIVGGVEKMNSSKEDAVCPNAASKTTAAWVSGAGVLLLVISSLLL